jgi:predicted unusual protein kinase regulating ubiquinone biosynthesis (AarF/ABC1/UbiB family)
VGGSTLALLSHSAQGRALCGLRAAQAALQPLCACRSALIDDFVALGFLPARCDRALIIPVMDRVLSPYLRGGGAAAFNFQALSQDLLSATLEIPFSVPPYMSLLARSVATLEGIALTGDPQYQMVAQAYPFVVRKVCTLPRATMQYYTTPKCLVD